MLFSDIHDFYRKIKGKKVAFIGIGVSHSELIRKAASCGALVTLCDKRSEDKIPEANELKELGVMLSLGEEYLNNIDADIVFRTPGMYFEHPALRKLRQAGVCITSEMELFFELCPCKIYAI
ncbi:MAG: UDP-N-acetylmuramoyl-L-alanine--D-glutamate ligase, partial [Oscillospiraceae bacterium]|nr:UDP-N-acetylmuramoyl-L-alanine--D-glutamate ligase [Oscillospiraceae bacterium]